MKKNWQLIAGIGGGLLIILVLANMRAHKDQTAFETSKKDSTAVAISADTAKIQEPVDVASGSWQYRSSYDKMSGDSNYFASVDAKELLNFDFPYQGGSKATILLRSGEDGTDILFYVSKGQIVSDENIRVKFDDLEPVTFSVSEPADYSSETIFINNERSFIKKLKAAKRVILEVGFYQEGNRDIEFDVSGLQWEH